MLLQSVSLHLIIMFLGSRFAFSTCMMMGRNITEMGWGWGQILVPTWVSNSYTVGDALSQRYI